MRVVPAIGPAERKPTAGLDSGGSGHGRAVELGELAPQR